MPSHSFMTHFCSLATSVSAPLPFLYASSVNEATVAWSIMRFIFSYFLCTASPEVWVQATICQNKESPIFQMSPFDTNYSPGWDCFGFDRVGGDHQHPAGSGVTVSMRRQQWPITKPGESHCGLCLRFTSTVDQINAGFLHSSTQSNVRVWVANICWRCLQVLSSSVMASRKRSGWSKTMRRWSGETVQQLLFFWPNQGRIIFQVGSFPLNLSFAFHQDNHCFTVVPLNRSRKRMREGMSAGRYDCTQTQCYHPDTVLLNIWRKSFCSIFWLSAGLRGSCWETHHLVSSFEVHFED